MSYATLSLSLTPSLLHGHSKDFSDHTIHFIDVFLIVWGGAAVVTVNAQLLRGKVYVIKGLPVCQFTFSRGREDTVM